MRAAPALLLALLVFVPRAWAQGVIAPGHEAQIVQLFSLPDGGAEVAPGLVLEGLSVEAHGFTASLLAREGGAPLLLHVTHDPSRDPPTVFTVEPEPVSYPVRDALAHLQERLRSRTGRAFWNTLLTTPEGDRPHAAPERFEDPRSPLATALAATALACLALALLLDRIARSVWSVVIASLLALVPIGAWWLLFQPPAGRIDGDFLTQWAQWRESQLVRAVLLVALAAGALSSWRARRRPGPTALDAAMVLAWSLVVRVVLTTPNILTDGGTGYTRLLHYSRGYSGLAVLVAILLPDASMMQAIWVPRLLAACTAPVVLLLARSLGASRGASLLAGLAIASLPVHAALYASDFEVGAVVMLSSLAALLVLEGQQRESAPLAALGCAIASYALWGRPEAVSVGALLAVALLSRPQRWWTRPVFVCASVWLAALALVRVVSLASLSLTSSSARSVSGPWYAMPLREWIASQALLPWWLWAPALIGLIVLRGRARLLVVLGFTLGVLPLHLTPIDHDPTRTFVEFFRYATGALPWLAIASGAGLFSIAAWLGRRMHPRVTIALGSLAGLAIVATPLAERAYLAREYGPTMEARLFREVLREVPADCMLVVPDDGSEAGEGHSMEVLGRYRAIAHEARSAGERVVAADRIVGMHQFLARHASVDGCLFVFRGAYCHDGLDGVPPRACDEVLAHLPLEQVTSRVIEYRSHRLVTAPERTDAPYFTPALALPLYRRISEKQADR